MKASKPTYRRWIVRHPLTSAYRAWTWWRWKRIPPWKLRAAHLVFINPAPLDDAALAGLQAMVDERIKSGL